MIKINKIGGGEGVHLCFEKLNAFSDTYPRYQNPDFLINSHLSTQECHGCDTQVVTFRLHSPTILISVFPNTQFPGFCLPETGNKLIATAQAKTSPTFCMRLNAPTANLQAYLHRFLGNSNTGGFSWNLMEVKGEKLILDNSAEHVLLPGFLLCPHKPFWNCLASYQRMASRAASSASFRHCKSNESGHKNTVLKSPSACWVCWGYWEKTEASFAADK